MKAKVFSIVLLFCVVATLVPASALTQEPQSDGFPDTLGHWAEDAVAVWTEYGIVHGSDGEFRPDAPIIRAELAALINRVVGYQESNDTAFSDVPDDAWYASDIAKLFAEGIMMGDGDGIMRPLANITREEAVVMLARAFAVEENAGNESPFPDAGDISGWASFLVDGMKAAAYISGDTDGNFNPKSEITRAEVVTILSNLCTAFYSNPGEYSGDVDGNVFISAADITLKDMKIAGDLYIMEGVGEGDVHLENVEVLGRVFARGGGANSLYLSNCTITEFVATKDELHIVLSNGCKIKVLKSDLKDGSIELRGCTVETMTIFGDGLEVRLDGESKIGTLNADAKGVKIDGSEGASIGTANLNGQTEITGDAAIEKANIAADGCVIETTPKELRVADGITATIAGQEQKGGTNETTTLPVTETAATTAATTTSSGSGSGGTGSGGSGGGGNNTGGGNNSGDGDNNGDTNNNDNNNDDDNTDNEDGDTNNNDDDDNDGDDGEGDNNSGNDGDDDDGDTNNNNNDDDGDSTTDTYSSHNAPNMSNIPYGTAFDQLGLPKEVILKSSKNVTVTVAAAWDESLYNATKTDTAQTITATISARAGETLPDWAPAAISVSVRVLPMLSPAKLEICHPGFYDAITEHSIARGSDGTYKLQVKDVNGTIMSMAQLEEAGAVWTLDEDTPGITIARTDLTVIIAVAADYGLPNYAFTPVLNYDVNGGGQLTARLNLTTPAPPSEKVPTVTDVEIYNPYEEEAGYAPEMFLRFTGPADVSNIQYYQISITNLEDTGIGFGFASIDATSMRYDFTLIGHFRDKPSGNYKIEVVSVAKGADNAANNSSVSCDFTISHTNLQDLYDFEQAFTLEKTWVLGFEGEMLEVVIDYHYFGMPVPEIDTFLVDAYFENGPRYSPRAIRSSDEGNSKGRIFSNTLFSDGLSFDLGSLTVEISRYHLHIDKENKTADLSTTGIRAISSEQIELLDDLLPSRDGFNGNPIKHIDAGLGNSFADLALPTANLLTSSSSNSFLAKVEWIESDYNPNSTDLQIIRGHVLAEDEVDFPAWVPELISVTVQLS